MNNKSELEARLEEIEKELDPLEVMLTKQKLNTGFMEMNAYSKYVKLRDEYNEIVRQLYEIAAEEFLKEIQSEDWIKYPF